MRTQKSFIFLINILSIYTRHGDFDIKSYVFSLLTFLQFMASEQTII